MNVSTTETTLPAVPNTLFFLMQRRCPQGPWAITNAHNEIIPKKFIKKIEKLI